MNSRSDNRIAMPAAPSTKSRKVAIDGLIAGTAAGVAMFGYLLLAVGESLVELLNRFNGLGVTPSPLVGALEHWAVSAIYGLIFARILSAAPWGKQSANRVIAGVAYGLILFAFSEWVMLPIVSSPLLGIPVLHWAIAHAIYGAVLGLILKPAN